MTNPEPTYFIIPCKPDFAVRLEPDTETVKAMEDLGFRACDRGVWEVHRRMMERRMEGVGK